MHQLPGNLVALCHHHRAKTHGGWKLVLGQDAACHWTSPAGRRYEVPAHGYPPDD